MYWSVVGNFSTTLDRRGVKVSKKQHEQTSTRLSVARVRRERGRKRRDSAEKKGDIPAGLRGSQPKSEDWR